MAAPKEKALINLLPQEEFESSTFGRVLKWLLSSFRIMVIITELVVMTAFLSRFWLDAKTTDLNDSIKQKQAVIESQNNFEKEFRKTQNRLVIFKEVTEAQDNINNLLSKIASSLPSDSTILSFVLEENTLQIRGRSTSEISIAQFIQNLKNLGLFSNVTLQSIETDYENLSSTVFRLDLKPTKKSDQDKEEEE